MQLDSKTSTILLKIMICPIELEDSKMMNFDFFNPNVPFQTCMTFETHSLPYASGFIR
jgi:hypothetical protein